MAVWRKEEEKAAESRRKKREAEASDKVTVAPGVTAGQLRRFRAALIGPLQGPPKRCRLLHQYIVLVAAVVANTFFSS